MMGRTAETITKMDATTYQKRPAWQTMAGRIARMFGSQYYDLFHGEKNLLSSNPPVDKAFPLQARMAEPADLEKITRAKKGDFLAPFDRYVAMGSTCYVACHDDEIVGFLWINRQSMEFLGMQLARLPPGHCFVHSVLVFPDARRKGVFQFLFRTVCDELCEDGYQSICCLVDRANIASIQAFSSEGTRFRLAPLLRLPGIRPIHFYRALT